MGSWCCQLHEREEGYPLTSILSPPAQVDSEKQTTKINKYNKYFYSKESFTAIHFII